jgi:hypothetical protein
VYETDRQQAHWVYFFIFVLSLLLMSLLVSCTTSYANEQNLQLGSITGRVYLDEDADAECDECGCDFYLEDIEIRLYYDRCAGVHIQIEKTDAEGIFTFSDLEPGMYCVSPKVKTICEGFQPTTPITQRVEVKSGEVVEAEWFGFDHFLDHND